MSKIKTCVTCKYNDGVAIVGSKDEPCWSCIHSEADFPKWESAEDMTSSHSEKDIYEGCISLMQDMMDAFEEYLDFIGIPLPDEYSEEERFSIQFYTTQIVERLFLWHTHHSGHTSQLMKLQELGIDNETVQFKDRRIQ